MTSLKRSVHTESNLSSKVYVRSTKSGKVQKIVREVYLRQDIPCSSQLCSKCLVSAPRSAAGIGEFASFHPNFLCPSGQGAHHD